MSTLTSHSKIAHFINLSTKELNNQNSNFEFYKYTKYLLPEILHQIKRDREVFKSFVNNLKEAENKIYWIIFDFGVDFARPWYLFFG